MEKKDYKNEIQALLASVPIDEKIEIDYSDDDILFIDNIKDLADTDNVRLNMNCLVVGVNGRAQGNMNDVSVELHQNELMLCAPNEMLSDIMVSPDFECKALFITNKGIRSILGTYADIWNKFIYLHRHKILKLEDDDFLFYQRFYDTVRMVVDGQKDSPDNREIPFRHEIVRSLLRGGLLGLCSSLSSMLEEAPVTSIQNGDIFSRFLDLLQNSEYKHRSVESYANQLCITPKYLTVICKKNSGKTAIEWITEYTLSDITYYLRNTLLSVKEISVKMGFPNSSFFGKYVRQHYGVSPQQYRQSTRK